MGLLVINVDHLPTHLLGPYGNTTVPTPTLNAWAARGGVVDWAFQSGPGGAVTEPGGWRRDWRRLADLCLTPEPAGDWQWPGGFGDAAEWTVDVASQGVPFDRSERLVSEWTETAVARYLERALSQWARIAPAGDARVWLDLPLLSADWDAPRAWRDYLAGDDDPEVYLGHQPPHLRLPSTQVGGLLESSGLDPDLRLGYEHAAGSMIMLLDHALEWLQNCLVALPGGDKIRLILTAETGFGLGEHLGIGCLPDGLWSDQTHVPFLVSLGNRGHFPFRISGVQSQDRLLERWWSEPGALWGTVDDDGLPVDRLIEQSLADFDWLNYTLFGHQQPAAVVSMSPNQIAVRTNAWSFLWKIAQPPLLFVRPDDRFEQNDLSSRCRAVAAGFQWYLPELLWHFGHREREIPSQFRETWLKSCRVLAAEGYCPETEDPARRLDPSQRVLALEELPVELWTNVI
jgi:hypothetical protein